MCGEKKSAFILFALMGVQNTPPESVSYTPYEQY